jgi:hypothetical protein
VIDVEFLNERYFRNRLWRVCECGEEIAHESMRSSYPEEWIFRASRVRHVSGKTCEILTVFVEDGSLEGQKKKVLEYLRQYQKEKL